MCITPARFSYSNEKSDTKFIYRNRKPGVRAPPTMKKLKPSMSITLVNLPIPSPPSTKEKRKLALQALSDARAKKLQ